MKVVIAGSRDSQISLEELENIIKETKIEIKEVVSGMSGNVDLLAVKFAEKYNYVLAKFPADWNKFGRSAGPRRNLEMAKYADAAVVIMKKEGSKGSKNMISCMKSLNKPVHVSEI